MSVPFNHCRPEYAESSIRKGLISGRLVEDDAVLIRSFCHEMQATVGITVGRTNKIVFTLVSLRRFIGPFAENTIQDLHSGIIQLRAAPSSKGKPFKANTIADHIAILKQFYTWLVENGPKTGLFLACTSTICPGTPWENVEAMVEGFAWYRANGRAR